MAGTVEQSIKTLIARMKEGLNGHPDAPLVTPLLDAIENGRLHFEKEPWYDIIATLAARGKTAPGELLLRARDENGALIAQEAPIGVINSSGLYALFDSAIVLAAVRQTVAQNDFPVSINISSRNACDADALPNLHKLLDAHFSGRFTPSQIIFEFLEDDSADSVCMDSLRAMKKLGYKFAIDDLSHEDRDLARLNNLGPSVDFVKIDGHTLEKARAGEIDFAGFVARIQLYAPQADILCEWVGSAEEAEDLNLRFPGIAMVQGRDLGHNADEFARRLRAACDRHQKDGPSGP